MTPLVSTEKIRAVVFHQGALGDFLIAAGAIEELARAFGGGARVDFWSKPEHVSLLDGKSYPGECRSLDGPLVAGLLQDSLWRSAALPDFLLEANEVFIFGQTGSRIMAERLSRRLSANVSFIQSFPAAGDPGAHVSSFLRRQLNDLGWPIAGNPLYLSAPTSEKQAAMDFLRRLGISSPPIFIHPGSGGRSKVWPLSNWHGLLDWIRSKTPFRALLSIGPADGYMDEFSGAMREAGVPMVSDLSPVRLSALLSLCGMYIGSDSGVSHLAAAVGIPAVAVFGPTDPSVWAPRGRNAVVVKRTWREEDVFAWAPSDRPDFQDKEIARLVLDMISE
jgi:hypothetical protein